MEKSRGDCIPLSCRLAGPIAKFAVLRARSQKAAMVSGAHHSPPPGDDPPSPDVRRAERLTAIWGRSGGRTRRRVRRAERPCLPAMTPYRVTARFEVATRCEKEATVACHVLQSRHGTEGRPA